MSAALIVANFTPVAAVGACAKMVHDWVNVAASAASATAVMRRDFQDKLPVISDPPNAKAYRSSRTVSNRRATVYLPIRPENPRPLRGPLLSRSRTLSVLAIAKPV